jgi:hypothetical protein
MAPLVQLIVAGYRQVAGFCRPLRRPSLDRLSTFTDSLDFTGDAMMARGRLIAALAGLCALTVNFGTAQAATIDYNFIGTGTGTLNGVGFSGVFDVNYLANTSTISSSGNFFTNSGTATFLSSAGFATLSSGSGYTPEVVLINGPTPGAASIGFAQLQPAPVFAVAEAVFNPAFQNYNLATAFALTGGSVSFLPQTYVTNIGNLSFTSISSLQFTALGGVAATPLPASWTLMLGSLVLGAGFMAFQRAKGKNEALISAAA